MEEDYGLKIKNIILTLISEFWRFSESKFDSKIYQLAKFYSIFHQHEKQMCSKESWESFPLISLLVFLHKKLSMDLICYCKFCLSASVCVNLIPEQFSSGDKRVFLSLKEDAAERVFNQKELLCGDRNIFNLE